MKTKTDFAKFLSLFMEDYLPHERNVSHNTIASYKISYVDFIVFIENIKHITVDRLSLCHLTRENVVEYLKWIEIHKGICTATRNYRLAAIKAFCRFLQYKVVDKLAQWQDILSIPAKKTGKKPLEYLTPDGIKLLLSKPDQNTINGRRHLAMLALMYDTAARVQEMADLTLESLRIGTKPYTIRIIGKGRKARIVPLSSEVVNLLSVYLKDNEIRMTTKTDPLFANNRGEKLTREGIAHILKKYADIARIECPEPIPSRISPHSIRHSRAMHLLHDGAMHIVDLMDFLGHASIVTTGIYARSDSKSKREALEKAYRGTTPELTERQWEADKDLLQ